MRPWPADTEPRFLRFLLNRVSGCVGGRAGLVTRALSLSGCARRAAECRCLRLAAAGVGFAARAFVLPRAGVCVRVVPCPALAQLLSAAAGAGGDGLLSRRARAALRRSTEGFAVAGLSLALFGGREHEIAERGRPAIDEIASLRLRTPIRAMVAFVLPPRHSLWHKKRWRDGAARTRLRRRSVHHEG